ncbi:hypothetical protein [Rufibacter roseolus]|uniref:hypothetical protein n=1 Tax=Rufibacter roseolus TaxID=2817375 RepID=UPI001B3087E2|nr:hypothetical protein [Rufibacter roseolus]
MAQKQDSKKKRLASFFLIMIGFGLVAWLFLKPEEEFHYYKLNECDDSYLTAIIYWKLGERGVVLVKGKRSEMPKDNFLIFNDLSGFDASFDAWTTCEKGTIIVNTVSHYFYNQKGSKEIRPRVLPSDIYKQLINEGNGKEVYLY